MQGLIKISAAFLKWHLRQQKGLEYLYTGAVNHFLKVSKEYPVCIGLNIAGHIQKLESHFKPVLIERRWPDPLNNYPLDIGKETSDILL